MITAFLNQKGGTGKTTLSYSFATALAMQGKTVLLVDVDPQHGSMTWRAHRSDPAPFPVVGIPTDEPHKEISAHKTHYEHIVIDAPPQASKAAGSIILAADLILIPVQPSPHDIWSAADIVRLIENAAAFKQNYKTAFVVNRKISNTALGRDVFLALESYPFPVLPTAICQRVAFAESAALGLSVLESEPNGAAAKEILSMTRDALELINGQEDCPRRRNSKPKSA